MPEKLRTEDLAPDSLAVTVAEQVVVPAGAAEEVPKEAAKEAKAKDNAGLTQTNAKSNPVC